MDNLVSHTERYELTLAFQSKEDLEEYGERILRDYPQAELVGLLCCNSSKYEEDK